MYLQLDSAFVEGGGSRFNVLPRIDRYKAYVFFSLSVVNFTNVTFAITFVS